MRVGVAGENEDEIRDKGIQHSEFRIQKEDGRSELPPFWILDSEF
jgi:hypothetical protein